MSPIVGMRCCSDPGTVVHVEHNPLAGVELLSMLRVVNNWICGMDGGVFKGASTSVGSGLGWTDL